MVQTVIGIIIGASVSGVICSIVFAGKSQDDYFKYLGVRKIQCKECRERRNE